MISRVPYPAARTGAWLRAERRARGWNVPEMTSRLRKAAAQAGDTLPRNAILDCHVRRWERGVVAPSERYKLHYCGAFEITAGQYGPDGERPPAAKEPPAALAGAATGVRDILLPPGPAAGREATPCLACLIKMVIDAIRGSVSSCQCAAPPADPAPPADAAPDMIRRAHQDGASIFAIAEVFRMTTGDVRTVLNGSGMQA